MRNLWIPFLCISCVSSAICKNYNPTNNMAAVQFRIHLKNADTNKDGFVTKEELVSAIISSTRKSENIAVSIASSMISDLDINKDGKLSYAEFEAGSTEVGEQSNTKISVSRAQEIMDAISAFKNKSGGTAPTSLHELKKEFPISATSMNCILANGEEKPWLYTTNSSYSNDPNSVMLYSPGATDSSGQYIVGLGNGQIIGMNGADLALEKLPNFNMQVYPAKHQ